MGTDHYTSRTDRLCLREGTTRAQIPILLDRRVLVSTWYLSYQQPKKTELTSASENVDGKVYAYTSRLDGSARTDALAGAGRTVTPISIPSMTH